MATTDGTVGIVALHRSGLERFGELVHGVPGDGWRQPTPCADWDVAELVNHVVGECLWAPPLLSGGTVAEVGDRFDGDLLGDDPAAAWDAGAAQVAAAAAEVALDATVHLSFADVPAEEYLWQLTADLLIHGWDLARATGQDEVLDPGLTGAVARWFDEREDVYRAAGVIGPPRPGAADRPDHQLLARFGRDASPDSPLAVIGRFNAAFNRHDLDALRGLVADDCVFVDTTPPFRTAHHGAAAVIAAFAQIFADAPEARFETLGGFVGESGAAYRWLYRWGDGDDDCVEGVDLLRVADGRVASKLAYVKG